MHLGRLIQDLWEIHPDLPAAVGHAMCFVIEDGSNDPVLVDPELVEAANAFYPHARLMAGTHTNIHTEETQ